MASNNYDGMMSTASDDVLLSTSNLTKTFGGLTAVDDVTVSFESDRLHSIIGPNGAGKTTFFNLITGSLQPTSGTVRFKNRDITDYSPPEIAREGLIKSYQTQQLFEDINVLENVRIAVQSQYNPYNFWNKANDISEQVTRSKTILKRVGLTKFDTKAKNLSHGEQRMLELAIALGPDPDLLLLDEPTSGMNADETSEMVNLIKDLSEEVTIVLVEHKMSVVMEVADRIVVLHNGSPIADGSPQEVQTDQEVRRVYLGEE